MQLKHKRSRFVARHSTASKRTAKQEKKAPQAQPAPAAKGHRVRLDQDASAAPAQAWLDAQAKRDIMAVVLIVCGIGLFAAATLQTNAVLAQAVACGLHLGFGLGAYLIPLVIVGIGCCLLGLREAPMPARTWVGIAIVAAAFLSLLALFTPGSSPTNLGVLFDPSEMALRGGYVGAGVAYVGLLLVGRIISCIVLVGVLVVGFVVLGFSISGFIARLRQLREERTAAAAEREPLQPPAFVRRLAERDSLVKKVPPADDVPDNAPTRRFGEDEVLPRAKTRRLSRSFDEDAPASEPRVSRPKRASAGQGSLTRKLGSAADEAPRRPAKPKTPLAAPRPADGFELPSVELLATSAESPSDAVSEQELQDTAAELQKTLEDFHIMAKVVGWVAGPTVTLFKVDLPAGVRVSRITALEADIALALAAPGVRIFAPIPGTNYVGIEVPNATRQTVYLGDVIQQAGAGPLEVAIGKDVEGHCIVSDLAKMPHLLIGGTTGSGKSVSINGMIMSILMRATPAEVRFIMIDPKRVEFTPYNGIPHLYVPVVTEPKEAASALSWGVAEMERRLKVFSKVGSRNIGQYNAKVQRAQEEAQAAVERGEEAPEADPNLTEELPYIVIIIDELADLMMNVGKEVEYSISRIAQLARAAGIHLIVATQRPSTNVVTGLIKANITNRIAFNVASGIDSRVILDTPGAENLIGLGDLLLSKPELAKPQRIQGCFVSEDEINAVVTHLREQGEPEYHSEILQTNLITLGASSPDGSGGSSTSDDPLVWEAADIVVSSGLGSTSNIQRRLKVGYSRAGRIMDMLEEKGVVGPANGSKPRDVLVDVLELETLKALEASDAASEG
ncbi:DNA translocase FtsK [Eggerthellaceae bacterium zg-887]|uniref:DNA translocase FtsK n=1 Tax=Xiamenia xianingshaonis TaxID=2682776 RepID=UPI00140B784C|nr:DNA translocase FtsK [Xiamenia xianingshaonis]